LQEGKQQLGQEEKKVNIITWENCFLTEEKVQTMVGYCGQSSISHRKINKLSKCFESHIQIQVRDFITTG